jgi:hypothetical protein
LLCSSWPGKHSRICASGKHRRLLISMFFDVGRRDAGAGGRGAADETMKLRWLRKALTSVTSEVCLRRVSFWIRALWVALARPRRQRIVGRIDIAPDVRAVSPLVVAVRLKRRDRRVRAAHVFAMKSSRSSKNRGSKPGIR